MADSFKPDGIPGSPGIPVDDFGVLYGFSLFETFLVGADCSVFLLERHIGRLFASLEFFNITLDCGPAEFKTLVERHIESIKPAGRILRVTVTGGNEAKGIKPSVFFTARDNPYDSGKYSRGFRLGLTTEYRVNEFSAIYGHKTANYLDNYLLGRKAAASGYDDLLLLNTKGDIAETTKSNIFFTINGRLHTPSRECGILPGIIREWALQKAADAGISCIEGKFHPDVLLTADEVFATNSVMGIMPVTSIDVHGEMHVYHPAEITAFLMNRYKPLFT